jgi:excisionase family DNA binding protein
MATIVLTLEEVAQFLRVHPSTVYRLLRRRTIPAFKVGSDWRFNQESVERWVKKLEITEGG